MGYKLEVPPIHPALAATLFARYGESSAEHMAQLPNTHMMLALMRDGFHPDSRGGNVHQAMTAPRCWITASRRMSGRG